MTSNLYRTTLAGAAMFMLLSAAGTAHATLFDLYSTPNLAIPDATNVEPPPDIPGATVYDTITFNPLNYIVDSVKVDLQIEHPYVGDLYIDLTHNGTTVNLWANACHDYTNGTLDVLFADGGSTTACADMSTYETGEEVDPALVGIGDHLSDFIGLAADGDWTISLTDTGAYDAGTLLGWSLHIDAHDPPPPPSSSPSSSSVPEPTTMALFGLGLTGLGLIRRRRKS